MMTMSVDYFVKIWEEKENSNGSYKQGDQSSWDNRVQEFDNDQPDERIGLISNLLREKKMLHQNSTVLDIGCGPGKFALEFAQTARRVVGLDISPKMLQKAAENAVTQGKGVEYKELDWEKADLDTLKWKKAFSLVTAIMSPALNSKESLDKMIEAGNDYCLISHFMERHDSIGDELKNRILGIKGDDEYGNRGIYCCLNILWHYKLYPEIVYFHTEREGTRPLSRAKEHYLKRLEKKIELTESQRTEIVDFLENKAENGMIREKINSKIACMYWQNRN